MQVIYGILLMSTGAAMGSLIQDPVVCRFNEDNQCYVALGQRLHLQLPLGNYNRFQLRITDKASTSRFILKYIKKRDPPIPNPPRWQFVEDNNTMILTSVERNDSGTYHLDIFDQKGVNKGNYSLQLNTDDEDSTLIILSTVCGLLIIISVITFYMYKKRQSLRNKKAQDQDKNVESAVVGHSSQSKQRKNQNELQYGELMFNNPTTNKSEMPKVQEHCIYSHVQFGQ